MDEAALSRRLLFQRYGFGALGLGVLADADEWEPRKSSLHTWEPVKARATGGIRSSHLLFLSSLGGWYPEWRPAPGPIEEQTSDALIEMKKRLESAGTTMDNVLQVTVALVDPMMTWAPMTEVYNKFFAEPRPARSYFGTTGFRYRGMLLSFDCIAYIE